MSDVRVTLDPDNDCYTIHVGGDFVGTVYKERQRGNTDLRSSRRNNGGRARTRWVNSWNGQEDFRTRAEAVANLVARRPETEQRYGDWLLHLTCCGHADGFQVSQSWQEADDFRNYYLDAPGHERSAVMTRLATLARCGFHDAEPE